MFSLIVATLNRIDELAHLLDSLEAQTFKDFEVIVVDQNPDDRLVPISNRHPKLAIRHLRSAPGLSKARNVGLPHAEGDIIAFPDDDCWYPSQLLTEIKEWFDLNPNFGAVFTALRDADNRAIGPKWPRTSCIATREKLFSYGISPNAFFRRSLTDEIGLFNENLGIGSPTRFQAGEDMDYFTRPLNLGVQMMIEPRFTVHHPSFHSHERLRRTTYSYAIGGAYVIRTCGYPFRFFAWCLVKSFGGALVSLARGDLQGSGLYLTRARAQLRGYTLGPRDMKHDSASQPH
jgi:glycosyltransferase involved in cell wall biosynthesis